MKSQILLSLLAVGVIAPTAFALDGDNQPINKPKYVTIERLNSKGEVVRTSPRYLVADLENPLMEVANLVKAYDGGGFNYAGTAGTYVGGAANNPGTGVTGAGVGAFRMRSASGGNMLNAPFIVEDTTLAAGTGGQMIGSFNAFVIYQPDGVGAAVSGTTMTAANAAKELAMTVFTYRQASNLTDGTDFVGRLITGFRFRYSGFTANGGYTLGAVLPQTSGVNFAAPADSGDGIYAYLEMRNPGGATVFPTPTGGGIGWARQAMYAAAENPAGGTWTNPSNSNAGAWVDLNGSNSIVTAGAGAEYVSDLRTVFNTMATAQGEAAVAISYGVDTAQFVCDAKLDLPTITSNKSMLAEIEYAAVDGSDNIINFSGGASVGTPAGDFATSPILGSDNRIKFPFPYVDPTGAFSTVGPWEFRYKVWVKPSHHLARYLPNILDFSNGSIDLTATAIGGFINGDVDEDNEIGPSDFDAVVAAFGTVPADALWNLAADLDEDGEVGPSDFDTVVGNFGLGGDAALLP